MITSEYAITALLWATTAWRATKVWRKGQERALWWAFFGLTVMMTLRLPVGKHIDELTQVTDLSYLLKQLSGGVLGPAALLTFLRDVSGQGKSPAWLRIWLPVATAVVLTGLFFAELQPYDTRIILTAPASRAAFLAYSVVLLGYLATSLVNGVGLCWRWGRNSGNGALGWGLRTIGVGLSLGVLYAVMRLTTLFARYADQGLLPGTLEDRVTSFLLMVSLLLILVGSTLPVLGKLRSWYTARQDLLGLYPLWLDLTGCFPAVRLHTPRSLSAERRDLRHVQRRLYRRSIEIRDAVLALSDYASDELRTQAESHAAARSRDDGLEATATAEACWLAVARQARIRGAAPAAARHHQPSAGGTDLAGEIAALRHLAHAYDSPVTASFLAGQRRSIAAFDNDTDAPGTIRKQESRS